MITIYINNQNFEYDIYSLVKAFYPLSDIKIVYEKPAEQMSFFLVIKYEADSINAKLFIDGKQRDDRSIEVDNDDRPDTKNRLKRLLYDVLSNHSGTKLEWGTLNGIRPTKIPLRLMEEGKSDGEILKYMQETYYISDAKGHECIDIAAHEYNLLKKISYGDGYSLYIGIPFCPTRCLYCSFTAYPISIYENMIDDYLDALMREILFVRDNLSHKKINTVYIGGGTPTSLDAKHLDRLLGMVRENLCLDDCLEFTVEAGRPDSITTEKLGVLKKHNVSRISINPQTMNQKTLDTIGRMHSVESVVEIFREARNLGFSNINMDIILGLPGEDEGDVKNTLEQIKKLSPDSLTVHSLALKRAARLNEEFDKYMNLGMKNNAKLMNLACEAAEDMNMQPYYLYRQKNMAGNQENIGFSKEGCEGLYNILIMEEKQTIIALGAGSACKYVANLLSGPDRSENVKDPSVYIRRIDEMIDRKRKKLEDIQWL